MPESREDLIRQVITGELSPDQVEDIARDAGLPALASNPPFGTFDPRLEEAWTLAMAVAWISDRSFASVERLSDKYRANRYVWVEQGPGYVLRPQEPAIVELMRGTRARGEMPDAGWAGKPGLRGAISLLWEALSSEELVATARSTSGNARSVLPSIQWNKLSWRLEEGRELVSPRGKACTDENALLDVRVEAADVQRLWPLPKRSLADLPDLVRPDQPGHMTLFHAALWISTMGGTVIFDPADDDVWGPAFKALTDRIAEGEVEVFGLRGDRRESIPREQFVGIRVSYPSGTTGPWFEEEPHLCSYMFIGQEAWESGHHDSIQGRDGPLWTKLLVANRDIEKHWPFEPAPPLKSGAPGRPTKSMHLVVQEFERRAAAAQSAPHLGEEARALLAWLRENYPNNPPPTKDTIANHIRKQFRSVKNPRK